MFAACADGATPSTRADVRAIAVRKSDVLAGISLVRISTPPSLTNRGYDPARTRVKQINRNLNRDLNRDHQWATRPNPFAVQRAKAPSKRGTAYRRRRPCGLSSPRP